MVKPYKFLLSLGVVAAFYLWLFKAATTPQIPSPNNPCIFYSNQQCQDLKLTFCHALKNAQKSIFLHMYAITDPDILKLLKKSETSGIKQKIFYDKSASGNLKSFSSALAHRGKGLMHRKILVIDHSLVFLSSANMTTQSLRFHDNLMLGIYHSELAHYLEQENFEKPCFFFLENQPCELWLLPQTQDTALHRILEAICHAQKKIRIALFTLTHPHLIEALIDAQKRGISVKLAIDFYTARGASCGAIKKLAAAGIPVYFSQGMQLLHHKWMLIDNTTLITGSANWTKAAFSANQDFFLVLSNLKFNEKKFMKKLWKTIQLESEIKMG